MHPKRLKKGQTPFIDFHLPWGIFGEFLFDHDGLKTQPFKNVLNVHGSAWWAKCKVSAGVSFSSYFSHVFVSNVTQDNEKPKNNKKSSNRSHKMRPRNRS
jgi:hypothetical protein